MTDAPTVQARHAFISYVREDSEYVDELQEALEAAGVSVWRDTQDLWPGQDWKAEIRNAIKGGSFAFIACFSDASAAREKSYQNEELTLAVEEFRQRPPGAAWLFTVRFSEIEIPNFDLGAGRRLAEDIHRTDLFGERKIVQTIRLAQSVGRVVNPVMPAPAVVASVANAKAAGLGRPQVDEFKRLLRDPAGDIALDDIVANLSEEIRSTLLDESVFPRQSEAMHQPLSAATFWIGQVRAYEAAIEPALQLVKLAGMYGLPEHRQIWTRLMQSLAVTFSERGGNTALTELRSYPVLLLAYVATFGGCLRHNYSPVDAFAAQPTVRVLERRMPFLLASGARRIVGDWSWLGSALCRVDSGEDLTEELVEGLRRGSVSNRYTPLSDHLYTFVSALFEEHEPDEFARAETFDHVEFLLDAVAADLGANTPNMPLSRARGGYGRYTWQYQHDADPPEVKALKELRERRAGWTPLLGGMFGGSFERAETALEVVVESAAALRGSQW